MLCREKSFARQGLAVFFALMLKSLMIFTLLAAPAAFAAAQPAADAAGDNPPAVKTGDVRAGKDLPAREKHYRELGEARDASAVEVLSRAALGDPEPGARIDAVLALRKIGGPEALKALLGALAAEKHKGVRIQAVNALGFFNSPEVLAELRKTVKNDPDKDLRISAVMALSRLNDAETLAASFDAEKDPAVKLGIIDALGRADGGGNELKKIRAKSKDAKMNKRLDFYTGEKSKKVKKK